MYVNLIMCDIVMQITGNVHANKLYCCTSKSTARMPYQKVSIVDYLKYDEMVHTHLEIACINLIHNVSRRHKRSTSNLKHYIEMQACAQADYTNANLM